MPAGFVLAKIGNLVKIFPDKKHFLPGRIYYYMERILNIFMRLLHTDRDFRTGYSCSGAGYGNFSHTDLQGELPDFGIISDSVRSLMMITDMERISAES